MAFICTLKAQLKGIIDFFLKHRGRFCIQQIHAAPFILDLKGPILILNDKRKAVRLGAQTVWVSPSAPAILVHVCAAAQSAEMLGGAECSWSAFFLPMGLHSTKKSLGGYRLCPWGFLLILQAVPNICTEMGKRDI